MSPTQLSHELRNAQSPNMQRRRWIVGLNLLGAAMGQIVSLYQTGIVKGLPDPPAGPFDSARVDASDYAYKRLRTPDALMMVVSYGVTAWLAGADGEDRPRTNPKLPLAMGAKIAGDIGTALQLAREEWGENEALCFYCQVATVCSVASFALAVPEMMEAARNVRNGER
jgi:hypothetical protein